MKRLSFLTKSFIGGIGITGFGIVSTNADTFKGDENKSSEKFAFKMGICADLHQNFIKDGPQTLQAFISEMNEIKPDFILQVCDFCVPKPSNQVIIDIWNQCKGG